MMLDDYKAGKLSPDDPWVVEALKRGLIQPRASNPYTNPDTSPKETRGFQPDPMAQKVRGLPAQLMQNAEENLTKNITALTPKSKESPYGSLRMPRMSDDSANAGMFVMAGPIAVEQALSKITAKVLPAKTIQDKLLQMGASKAELETRGVTQFLESKGARPIFPKEVAKHLEENPYQLKEVVKGKVRPDSYQDWVKREHPELAGTPRSSQVETKMVAEYNESVGQSTKFHEWQTPGGENYREILMTSPQKEVVRGKDIRNTGGARPWKVFVGGEKEHQASFATEAEAKQFLANHPTFSEKIGEKFTGGHWDEPNVVAHMRVNDRTLPSGEKALHVEEWQSDWALAKRSGEKTIDGLKPVAPSHPLVDNWQDLMARRTLKEAADGGYDRLTWTTGQQQADRYDLSKHIANLYYRPFQNGTYAVEYTTHSYPQTRVGIGSGISEKEIADQVGKDVASRIVKGEGQFEEGSKTWRSLSGLDLKVGGEWANKLYDESMVNRFNKIGKRYGVQVEDAIVQAPPVVPKTHREYGYEDRLPKVPTTFHSLKITPEMRQSIGAVKFHPFADLPSPK